MLLGIFSMLLIINKMLQLMDAFIL